jgi:uracil-DNA glycosylase family 4
MTLLLDTRQRAMLQAMGITLWGHEPLAVVKPPQTPVKAHQPQRVKPAHPPHTVAAPPPLPQPASQPPANTSSPTASTTGWVLHAPQQLFTPPNGKPTTQPALNALVTNQVRQARWFIVAQNASPAQPLAGDWGALLGNMLQAMGLHQHPDVWITTLEAPLSAALMPTGPAGVSNPPDITNTIAQLAPSMVLLLGTVAARAALGHDRGSAPLNQLRGQVHLIGQQPSQYPAIVTYDPSFLLRSAHNKAGAWVDLCTALAHINGTHPSHPPSQTAPS